MQESRNNTHIPLIDISRLLCALSVVLIHFRSQLSFNPIATMIIKCFSNQAVPFFMIVSGFFWARKCFNNKSNNNIIEITKRICINYLLIYFVWTILWTPWFIDLYKSMYGGTSKLYLIFVFIRRYFIAGQGVYWFLLVLAESLFVAAILIKYDLEKLLYAIGFCGLILGLLYDANFNVLGIQYINRLCYLIFGWSNNLFMKGLPYVAIGYFLSKNYDTLIGKIKSAIIFYSLSSIIMIILYSYGYYDLLCLHPIQAICLFIISLQPIKYQFNKLILEGCRNLSSCIYYLHTVFKYGLATLLFNYINSGLGQVFTAVLLSSIVCYVVKKLDIKPVMWLLSMK